VPYINLTIQAGKVASDLSNFVTYIDLSDMPSDFWSGVSGNGGDIRVKTTAGADLPTDLVWIDVATQTGALFFRASLLAASDNVFRIYYGTGLSRLAVNDAYGRNAVWQDFAFVTLLGIDPNDRTGNGTLTVNGDPQMFEVVATHTLSDDPHQGVAWDGQYWYLFHTDAIYKYDSEFNLIASNTNILVESGLSGVNHLSDGTYHDGYLYSVLEVFPAGSYTNQHLVKFNASDLSIAAIYDISDQGHECSSVCYCERDGYLYITDFTSDAVVHKYTLTGGYIGTLAVAYTSVEMKIQGIEWFGDAFWLVADETDEIYRMEYSGAVINTGLFGNSVSDGFIEGICRKNDRLVVLEDPNSANSYLREWRPIQLDKSGGGGYSQATSTTQHINAAGLSSYTTFTLGVTVSVSSKSRNRAALSYHDESAGATNTRVTIAGYSSVNTSIGVWDPNNSWLLPSPAVNPDLDTAYRVHAVYSATAHRKIYVDGALKNTQNSITAAPSALDRLLIGREDDSNSESFAGELGYAYLRAAALSGDWIAAEYDNLNSPSAFYSVSTYVYDNLFRDASGQLVIANSLPPGGSSVNAPDSETFPDITDWLRELDSLESQHWHPANYYGDGPESTWQIPGGNIMPNADLAFGADYWEVLNNAGGGTNYSAPTRDLSDNTPAGSHSVGVSRAGTTDAASDVFDIIYNKPVNVLPSSRYELSAYLAAVNCTAAIFAKFYKLVAGVETAISTSDIFTAAAAAGGNDLSDWNRAGGFVTTPADAQYLKFGIRGSAASAADPVFWASKLFVGQAYSGQAELSPWAAGGNSGAYGELQTLSASHDDYVAAVTVPTNTEQEIISTTFASIISPARERKILACFFCESRASATRLVRLDVSCGAYTDSKTIYSNATIDMDSRLISFSLILIIPAGYDTDITVGVSVKHQAGVDRNYEQITFSFLELPT
jgi:hypothetical protein